MQSAAGPRIIVALDYPTEAEALALVERLDPAQCRLKVGKELFVSAGPRLVEQLSARGFSVFLDLKFHDIPNTVARACKTAADLGVWMMNVHASGGRRMMEAARESLEQVGAERPLLIAVTVLTSMGPEDLQEVGLAADPLAQVSRLAALTENAGLDGVVCSAKESAVLHRERRDGFVLVTPGIRPEWAAAGDQKRITTPAQAMADGSTYLVIGRPITGADDPLAALRRIQEEIG